MKYSKEEWFKLSKDERSLYKEMIDELIEIIPLLVEVKNTTTRTKGERVSIAALDLTRKTNDFCKKHTLTSDEFIHILTWFQDKILESDKTDEGADES